jgi:hypothetical protein
MADGGLQRVARIWGGGHGRTTATFHDCRMDLPGPTTSVGTRTDNSVGPWDYPTCAARYLMA